MSLLVQFEQMQVDQKRSFEQFESGSKRGVLIGYFEHFSNQDQWLADKKNTFQERHLATTDLKTQTTFQLEDLEILRSERQTTDNPDS